MGGISYREGIFSCWNDPSVYGLFYHSALMVRRCDITPAEKKIGIRVPCVSNFPAKAYGSGMKVECHTDFAVVALSSLTDEPIASSDNLLLSTVGRSRNTDSQFDGEKMVEYGHAPIVSEVIRAKITIDTDRTDLRVWGVNAEGVYVGKVPAVFENGKMTFTVGENFPCMYYLISAD